MSRRRPAAVTATPVRVAAPLRKFRVPQRRRGASVFLFVWGQPGRSTMTLVRRRARARAHTITAVSGPNRTANGDCRTWTAVALPGARIGHSAAHLANAKVLSIRRRGPTPLIYSSPVPVYSRASSPRTSACTRIATASDRHGFVDAAVREDFIITSLSPVIGSGPPNRYTTRTRPPLRYNVDDVYNTEAHRYVRYDVIVRSIYHSLFWSIYQLYVSSELGLRSAARTRTPGALQKTKHYFMCCFIDASSGSLGRGRYDGAHATR